MSKEKAIKFGIYAPITLFIFIFKRNGWLNFFFWLIDYSLSLVEWLSTELCYKQSQLLHRLSKLKFRESFNLVIIIRPQLIADILIRPQLIADNIIRPQLMADNIIRSQLIADNLIRPQLIADSLIWPQQIADNRKLEQRRGGGKTLVMYCIDTVMLDLFFIPCMAEGQS